MQVSKNLIKKRLKKDRYADPMFEKIHVEEFEAGIKFAEKNLEKEFINVVEFMVGNGYKPRLDHSDNVVWCQNINSKDFTTKQMIIKYNKQKI